MKVVEEELLDSRMEESGIFLIWAGRPIRMNFKRAVCISCRRHPQVGGGSSPRGRMWTGGGGQNPNFLWTS